MRFKRKQINTEEKRRPESIPPVGESSKQRDQPVKKTNGSRRCSEFPELKEIPFGRTVT